MSVTMKRWFWWLVMMAAPVAVQAQSGKLDGAYLCGQDGTCTYSSLVPQRYELVVTTECGAWHDRLKADNPNVMTFIYTSGTDNYTQPADPNGGWYYGAREHAWLKQRCRELGYSPEILYMHYYENTVVSGYTIPGTYSSTVTDRDSLSRVPVYLGYYHGSGVGRILVNFSHPITRQLEIEYAKKAWTDPNAGHDWPQTSYWDGYYLDNWLGNEIHPDMGQIGNVSSGGRLAEHPTRAVITTSDAVSWFQQQMNTFARQLRDTLHNGTAWAPDHQPKYLAANVATSWVSDFVDPNVAGIDYLLQEFQYNPVRCYKSQLIAAYSRDSACYAHGVHTLYAPMQTLTPSSGSGSVAQGEALYDNLAWYYVSRSPNTYIYQNYNNPSVYWISGGWDTLTWRGCMDFDVGTSLGRYAVQQTGTDPVGYAYTVFKREYSNALVLVRPRGQWNEDITPQTAVTITLPTSYREVRIDGTLGPLATTFTLRNGRGLILAKPGGGTTEITPPTPFDPAHSGTVTVLQPTLKVNNAQDPLSRSLQYQFQLDGNGDFAGGDLVWSSPADITFPTGTTTAWSVPQALTDGSSYRWRSRVISTSGVIDTSEWSSVFLFTVSLPHVNTCPTAPTASSPAAGAQVTTTTPQLTVTNATDLDGDVLTYEFVVCSDAGMTTVVTSAAGRPQGTGSTSWTVSPGLTSGQTYYWRARASDGQCAGDWCASRSFSVTAPPNSCPTAPTASSPAGGAQVSVTPQLTVTNATDADGDVLTYEFVVCSDVGMTIVVVSVSGRPQGTGSTSWTVSPGLTAGQTYYWRARAYDGACAGGWSVSRSFSVSAGNQPPPVPTGVSPIDNDTVLSGALQLTIQNVADPNGDPVQYQFALYKDGAIIQVQDNVAQGGSGTTSWQPTVSLTKNYPYTWRVQCHDPYVYSGWTGHLPFFLKENLCPSVPTANSPANGATMNDNDPPLVVQNSTDGNGDPLTYQFVVCTDLAMANVVASASGVPAGSGTTSWTISPPLSNNQTYYWQARASDGSCQSGWTAVRSFRVSTTNQPPPVPTGIDPVGGDTITYTSLWLTVQNVVDPESDVVQYQYALYKDGAMIQVRDNVTQGSGSTTSWRPTIRLSKNRQYTWRVQCHDPYSYSGWTSPYAFYYLNIKPPRTTAVSPRIGDTLLTQSVVLSLFNVSDADGDAVTYEFEIYADPNLQNLVTRVSGVAPQGDVATWLANYAPQNNKTYWWRGRAVDDTEPGEWSEPQSFLTSYLVVDVGEHAPELTAPVGGAALGEPRPRFEIRVPPEAVGTTCEFGVATDAAFADVVAYSGALPVDSSIVEWRPDHDLALGPVYYWRARVAAGDWSETASFIIQPDVHFAPNPYVVSRGGTVSIYNLPSGAEVELFTVSGRHVITLTSGNESELAWPVANDQGEPLAPGVYLYTVRAPGLTVQGKFVISP